jgi:signal transduction histidine kinase/CheY-like chemotaxis protein
VLGQHLNVVYRPTIENHDISLGWAWMVLFCGSVITLLVGGLVFGLINRNIAVQKEVEAKTVDLREASAHAIHANQTKSRFLANVSHEVRTPLNLMLGMAEVLSETPVTVEQRNYIATFRRAGNHLLELVNDVLDVASIEAGEVPYIEEDMSLVELMENVSDFVSVACRVKKLSYTYEIDPAVPKVVRGDSKRLRQVLINLVNNSIKFTERGGIGMRLHMEDGRTLFEVTDTGVGIPPTEVDKIFGEFYQVNSSSTRLRAGVGLGLAIVKTYVEHLRGSVDVQSELGIGSIFKVSLNLQAVGPETWLDDLLRTSPAKAGSRVLVVSPNVPQSGFIRTSLEYLGYQVSVVEAGRSALKLLNSGRDAYSHLIIDLVGRDMGGLDILRNLHLQPEELSKVVVLCPIVHRARDPEFLADLGINQMCYAPIKIGALLKMLAPATVKAPVPQPAPVEVQKGIRLLIAEDDEDNRFLLQTYLSSLDIELSFANDGRAALERYKGLAPDVDLLITDIQMPRMDGFDLIREVRRFESDKNLDRVPIVALTADAQSEQVERVHSLGGNGYLTKPISKVQLLNLLAKYRAAA